MRRVRDNMRIRIAPAGTLPGETGWHEPEPGTQLTWTIGGERPTVAVMFDDVYVCNGLPVSHEPERYYLTLPGQPEREVTRLDWVRYESGAGFHGGGPGQPATWSFSGVNGVSGRREYKGD